MVLWKKFGWFCDAYFWVVLETAHVITFRRYGTSALLGGSYKIVNARPKEPKEPPELPDAEDEVDESV